MNPIAHSLYPALGGYRDKASNSLTLQYTRSYFCWSRMTSRAVFAASASPSSIILTAGWRCVTAGLTCLHHL